MFYPTLISLAFAASALANVFIINPVSTTTLTAGQSAVVNWQDDGNKPSLSSFGNATFGIYVGNALQQTLLQQIATYIDVSAVNSISFTPNAGIGENSNEYFIRVTSQSLKDSSNPQYYVEAFSAKFTLAGMSGKFNSTLQDEINGQSTAPLAAPTAASNASSASTPAASGASMTAAPASSASSSASASSTSANGAAKPVIATGFVGLVAVLIGASLL